MSVKLAVQTVFSALDKQSSTVAAMGRNTERYAKQARRAGETIGASWSKVRGLIAGAVAVLTTGLAAKAVKDFADKGDEISRMANILGVTTAAWQEMTYAAKMSDMTTDDLSGAFKRMNSSMGQLRGAQGPLYTYLKRSNPELALQLKHTRNSEDAFGLLMEAISKETDTAKRAALTQSAFGRGGQGIIEMAKDYAKLREEARSSGGMIDPEDIAAGKELHENLKRLTVSGQGFVNKVLGAAVRYAGPWLEKLNAWISANRQLINQKIERFINGVANAVKTAYDIFARWWPVIKWTTIAFVALNIALKAFAVASAISKGITLATAAMQLFTNGAKAATVAQLALNAAQRGGLLTGAGGKVVQGAITAAAGGGLAAAAATAIAPAAIVVGAAALGQEYARRQNAMITSPGQIAGGNRALMSGRQVTALDAMRLAEARNQGFGTGAAQKSTLEITLNGFPAGTSAKLSGSGAPAITVGTFNTLRGM